MKKLLLGVFLFLIYSETYAYSKYWIRFTDKNGTPYTTSNPSAFLSARSIQRRVNQGIAVNWNDLPVNPSYVSQVLATGAVTLNYTSRWMNAISITTTDANALAAIAALPFVVSTQPVKMHKRPDNFIETGNSQPNRMNVAESPSTSAYNYGGSYGQVHQINVDCLHNQGYHGEGKIIAVLDDGFDNVNIIPAFDSIRLNNQILGTYDFVAGTSAVYAVGGHGTMVLSCMASNLPGQIIGTAPKAQYYLLRTEDATSEYVIEEDNWVAGAEYADSCGADIITSSLYYTQFDDATQNHTYADMNGRTTVAAIAATFTARVGMLSFVCAGNSGTSSWFYIGTPADADSILAVGAVDATGATANFSSRGPSYDHRIKPDIAAMGVNATVVNSSATLTTASGTSFATPLSAGGAACLWQSQPGYSAMALRYAIQQGASQHTTPDSLQGYGIPDFCNSSLILSARNQSLKQQKISVYPNPNKGTMWFSASIEENKTGVLEIYSLEGKQVYSANLNPGQRGIELRDGTLEDGLYFYRLTVEGVIVGTEKLVIMK